MSEREVVLFVHSTGTGPFLWAGVPDAAIGSRPKLLPSNIGYPPEPIVERGRPITAEDDAVHIVKFLPADARIHVVAHSYGALVALHAIPAFADRLASVFFFEPIVFGGLTKANDADPAAVEQARKFASHPWFLTDT